ncbi:MAG: prepilin peptidase [Deferribacterales bacterium]|nr:prepilin peptidase [Deferribacterales bacterium]
MSFFAALLGLVFGSFMNVLIYRIPKGISIVSPPSSCPQCGGRIKWFDNIPVISWCVLKGRCRCCFGKISFLYPIVELLTGATFVLIYLKFGASLEALKYGVFCFLLLTAAFTDIKTALDKDFETGVIPTVYPFIGVIIALSFALYEGNFLNSLSGWASGYLVLYLPAMIYTYLTGREGIGEGDFILFAMIGAFLGPMAIPMVLTVGAFVGVVVGIIIIVATKNRRYPIPFAPMLALGGMFFLLFDNVLKISF